MKAKEGSQLVGSESRFGQVLFQDSNAAILRFELIKSNFTETLLELPFVSVIVTTVGRKWIRECLRNLAQYYYPRYEVIVVYNISGKGPGYARNRGLEVARGDLIHFIDDDAVPSRSNLLELVRTYLEIEKHDRFLGGISGALVDPSGIKSVGLRISFSRFGLKTIPEQTNRVADCVFTCNALFSKQILNEVKGFDEEISHQFEDVDLSMKVRSRGYRLYTAPDAIVYHVGGVEKLYPLDKQLRAFYASRNYIILVSKWISFHDAFLRGTLLAMVNTALIFASILVAIVAKITRTKSAFLFEIGLPHVRFQKTLGSLCALALLSRRMKARRPENIAE